MTYSAIKPLKSYALSICTLCKNALLVVNANMQFMRIFISFDDKNMHQMHICTLSYMNFIAVFQQKSSNRFLM